MTIESNLPRIQPTVRPVVDDGSVRKAADGVQPSVRVEVSSVRPSAGVCSAEVVDQAVERDLTRGGGLGNLFDRAFDLPAPKFELEKLKD